MADIVNTLKLEGNALHQQRDFTAAYEKYTEAINKCTSDKKTLAILYSNRAAASLNLKDYLDAIRDGQKSTTADPSFVKGYIRTATAADAINMFSISLAAWKSASRLTTDPLIKADCTAKIKAVEAAQTKHEATISEGQYHREMPKFRAKQMMPWARAISLLNQNRLSPQSSGNVIIQAWQEFEQGLDRLKRLKVRRVGGSEQIMIAGKVLEPFTNAILCDPRCFHSDSSFPEFFENLERQVKIEVLANDGWTGGPKELIKEVPARLRNSTWDTVRPFVTITLRAWLLRAYLDSNMGMPTRADEFYKRVVDVIEWGRATYPNVPRTERGSIFEPTIVRGVRTLRLNNLLDVYKTSGVNGGYTLDDIAQLARDLKSETDASERPTAFNGHGFFGFWTYPVANAISVLGWVKMQKGLEHLLRSEDADDDEESEAALNDSVKEFSESANFYLKAAHAYPIDDECHPYMLSVALEAQWRAHAPLRVTLPLARKVRDTIPGATEIWEATMSDHMKTKFKEAAEFLEQCEREIAKGNWKLDDCLGLARYDVYPRPQKKKDDDDDELGGIAGEDEEEK